MKLNILLFVLLLCSVFLEASTLTLPLVFLFLLFFYIYGKQSWVFLVSFFFGLLLDVLTLRPVGETSIFFLIFLLLLFLYERKFERFSAYFLFFSSFFGSVIYLWLFDVQHIFLESSLTACLALIFFFVANRIINRRAHLPYAY